jgi:hypothetical protein
MYGTCPPQAPTKTASPPTTVAVTGFGWCDLERVSGDGLQLAAIGDGGHTVVTESHNGLF